MGFKKQSTSKVNPLLAQLDISKLGSGNYYLVIEIRDQNNIMQLEKSGISSVIKRLKSRPLPLKGTIRPRNFSAISIMPIH